MTSGRGHSERSFVAIDLTRDPGGRPFLVAEMLDDPKGDESAQPGDQKWSPCQYCDFSTLYPPSSNHIPPKTPHNKPIAGYIGVLYGNI